MNVYPLFAGAYDISLDGVICYSLYRSRPGNWVLHHKPEDREEDYVSCFPTKQRALQWVQTQGKRP